MRRSRSIVRSIASRIAAEEKTGAGGIEGIGPARCVKIPVPATHSLPRFVDA